MTKEEMTIIVKVIDAPMGTGKTSAMINFMNETGNRRRFIFVTPFLAEGQRVIDACPNLHFQDPQATQIGDPKDKKVSSKLIDFKRFLRNRDNIVTTHALFERFDPEAIQLIADGGYTMVMDEVPNAASKAEFSPKDAHNIMATYADIDSSGLLSWKDTERAYWGKYDDAMKMCEIGVLWRYRDSVMLKMLPPGIFEAFDDVYLMTYMFEAQITWAYFRLFGIEYEHRYVVGNSPTTYQLTEVPQAYYMPGLTKLINICRDPKFNLIGKGPSDLSVGWYNKEENKPLVKKVKDNVYRYFRHTQNATANQVLWASFRQKQKPNEPLKEMPPIFTPHGYSTGFLACNARATNAYRARSVLAYPLNRYLAPELKNFFAEHDIVIDEKQWALSEMVQWIWRSSIRDNQSIELYLPSSRMRELLDNWIKQTDSDENTAA